ncbi:MAG TPA: arginase family protein [Candidatus Synoicihabitans sp.]|nr:arginase family protein [Candidatus Synoicihabitans sp.]
MPSRSSHLSLIGAPTSAGAYAPGQEKAPAAFRQVGLVDLLANQQVRVIDRGDVSGFRWRPDPANRRAMHAAAVADVATAVAWEVAEAVQHGNGALVLGGDCTVELGTVAGVVAAGVTSVGLVYVDLDTDLNTPTSTADGALDWMGVAHLLGIPGTICELTAIGRRVPLLQPEQVMFFAHANVEPCERRVITEHGIAETPCAEVAADPWRAGQKASHWARRFDRLLVHLDVDVLSFVDTPLAENVRRNLGLRLDTLMLAITPLLHAPNLTTLTITEVNPDHGAPDGSTLRGFAEALATVLSGSRFT